MATALVTGATGFVGSWVARTLRDAGHDVRILRRGTSRLDAIQDLQVTHFVGDITEADVLAQAVQGADWVFHVAAISAYWRTGKRKIYEVNVDATRLLLNASLAAGVKRFIFTSSAAAAGIQDDGGLVNEDHVYNIDPSLSPYGHSKYLAEAEVYQAMQRGLDCVILNPSVILGPADLNLISGSLVIQIAQGRVPFLPLHGGICVIDVRDVAMSHLRAAEKGQGGERYLLGQINIKNSALFNLIAGVVNKPAPMIPMPAPLVQVMAVLADLARGLRLPLPGDVEGNQLRLSTREIYFDSTKAREQLHEPEFDLPQSIRDTFTWYREHGYI